MSSKAGTEKRKSDKAGTKYMANNIVTSEVFDLDAFDYVKLGKPVEFTPATDVNEALSRLSGDAETTLKVLNLGLLEMERNRARASNDGWRTFEEDEKTLNGPYVGTPADMKQLRTLVNALAVTAFGYSPDLSREDKQKVKAEARDFIKSNDAIREKLRRQSANVAIAPTEDSETE